MFTLKTAMCQMFIKIIVEHEYELSNMLPLPVRLFTSFFCDHVNIEYSKILLRLFFNVLTAVLNTNSHNQ